MSRSTQTIVEKINALGDKSYRVELHVIYYNFSSNWITATDNIENYEDALKIKNDMETEILRNTIVKTNIL